MSLNEIIVFQSNLREDTSVSRNPWKNPEEGTNMKEFLDRNCVLRKKYNFWKNIQILQKLTILPILPILPFSFFHWRGDIIETDNTGNMGNMGNFGQKTN